MRITDRLKSSINRQQDPILPRIEALEGGVSDGAADILSLQSAVSTLQSDLSATSSPTFAGLIFGATAGGEDIGFVRQPEGTATGGVAPIKPWTLRFSDHGIVQANRDDQIMDFGYNFGSAGPGLYDTGDLGWGQQFESYFLNGGQRWLEWFVLARTTDGEEYRPLQINTVFATTDPSSAGFVSTTVGFNADSVNINSSDGTQRARFWGRNDFYQNVALVTNNTFYYGVKVDGTFCKLLGMDSSDVMLVGDGRPMTITTDTSTGLKIGTAASQKIGFFGKTPHVQAAKASYSNWGALSNVVQALVDLGLFDAA